MNSQGPELSGQSPELRALRSNSSHPVTQHEGRPSILRGFTSACSLWIPSQSARNDH